MTGKDHGEQAKAVQDMVAAAKRYLDVERYLNAEQGKAKWDAEHKSPIAFPVARDEVVAAAIAFIDADISATSNCYDHLMTVVREYKEARVRV